MTSLFVRRIGISIIWYELFRAITWLVIVLIKPSMSIREFGGMIGVLNFVSIV